MCPLRLFRDLRNPWSPRTDSCLVAKKVNRHLEPRNSNNLLNAQTKAQTLQVDFGFLESSSKIDSSTDATRRLRYHVWNRWTRNKCH